MLLSIFVELPFKRFRMPENTSCMVVVEVGQLFEKLRSCSLYGYIGLLLKDEDGSLCCRLLVNSSFRSLVIYYNFLVLFKEPIKYRLL